MPQKTKTLVENKAYNLSSDVSKLISLRYALCTHNKTIIYREVEVGGRWAPG